jgi:hypothetical protein
MIGNRRCSSLLVGVSGSAGSVPAGPTNGSLEVFIIARLLGGKDNFGT